MLGALALYAPAAFAAQAPVGLGTAGSFGVLAGSTVTNTGPSTINGDLGVNPGAAITGFPPGTVNGTTHAADAVALQAQSDLTTAYNDAAGRTPAATVSGDLGGRTLVGGVYKSASTLGLTGTLTLDAQGDPNSVFIFQAGSTLITASGSRVSLVNGAQPCNVYWQVGSSATLGTSSVFAGNILALTSVSINDGVTVIGRALARNGAVTLINDTISASHCATGSDSTDGGSTGDGTSTSDGSSTGAKAGTARLTTVRRSIATSITRFGTSRCVHGGFRAAVTGRSIRRVVFSMGGRVLANRTKSPFQADLRRPRAGIHTVLARVTFTDATRARTLRLRFRTCAAAIARPVRGPSGFTG
jgi:hypothetical protein